MGLIRFLLAISVVVTHTYGSGMVGGVVAVQLFYLVSGFVISLIVTEKRYKNLKTFYLSRFLRLYPTYIFIAILTYFGLLVERVVGGESPYFTLMGKIENPIELFLSFSNITLLFQDWVMFLCVKGENLAFTMSFSEEPIQLWQGLLVPQAWTLGVEITFYLVAPFLLSNKKLLISLAISSLLLRLIFIHYGLGLADPWTYRFFPLEVGVFSLGAIAHQFLLPSFRRIKNARLKNLSVGATFGFAFVIILYPLIPGSPTFTRMVISLLFFISLPLFYIYQENRKFDRILGDFSYPIYICHVLVLRLVLQLGAHFDESTKMNLRILTVVVSIVFAIIINFTIVKRVEQYRTWLKNE
jgi:peptidoglycan/LPS O-acetylase OafA/YrhL